MTDFKRELDCYKARRGRFDVVEVPPLQFLMIDGAGDPNTDPQYSATLETLYPMAYKLKFFNKKELGRDYTVMPLEGLWWADDMAAFTVGRDKAQWLWTMMIMVPGWIEAEHVEVVRAAVGEKAPRLADLRVETFDEGLSVQTLHVGRFDDEGPVLQQMHEEAIVGAGYALAGKHHEIYLSDARRTAPEKLRTILRQPVERQCHPGN